MVPKTMKRYLVLYSQLITLMVIGYPISTAFAQGTATVTGVVEENGSALDGAVVYISDVDENLTVNTDATGVYSGEVDIGVVTIVAYTAAGEYIGDNMLTLADGQILTTDFSFTPWVITGSVTENGSALSGAKVRAGRNESIATDSAGNYSARIQGEEVDIYVFTAAGEFIGEQAVVDGVTIRGLRQFNNRWRYFSSG